ncbi:MAG: DUF1826 domain-containing protein, partial [Bacteroidota bacterium]
MVQVDYASSNAVISSNENKLKGIHEPSKNIAIWKRDTNDLQPFLHQLKDLELECRSSGTKEEILVALENYFQHNIPRAKLLYQDISKLLTLFENLTEASSLRVLLTTVKTDMCRKFHTDVNDLRLLCTYLGPGTLWVPDAAIQEATTYPRKKRELQIDESKVQQVTTGDVVVLKGGLYPEATPIL